LAPLPLGDSLKLKLGHSVIAIGNALGEFKNTVSTGVVSGLDRSVDIDNGTLTGLIQTDAAINKGNSGGPLLNLAGEVVGINTAMALGAENIGFAIPINQVKRVIKSVEQNGSLKVAYLGVRYQIVTKELQDLKNLSVDYGALIVSGENDPGVASGSPASIAGIKEGDIILELNSEKLTKDNTLVAVLRNHGPGDKVFLKIMRDGKEMNLEATLGEK
jgi:serine protease Do